MPIGVTVAQVKEHWPQLTGNLEDSIITTMIGRADALMALHCNFPRPDGAVAHTLGQATYTLYPDPPTDEEPRRLRTGIRPIISVTSVHSDPLWAYGADTEIPSGDRVTDLETGDIWLKPNASTSFHRGVVRDIKVVLSAGFATAPDELVALVAMTVRHLLDLRHGPTVQSITAGGQSVTREAALEVLPRTVQAALSPYVLWGRACG